MRTAQHYLVYLLVRFLICFIQALPLRTCARFSQHLGWFLYAVVKLRRDVVEENLSYAFPERSQTERDRIAIAAYQHMILMVCEIAQAPRKIYETNWRDYVTIHHK